MNRLSRHNMDLITSYCATSPDAGHNGIARCDRLCFDCWRQHKIRWARDHYIKGRNLYRMKILNDELDEDLEEWQNQLIHDYETGRSGRALDAVLDRDSDIAVLHGLLIQW
jgi:hypothetical protein